MTKKTAKKTGRPAIYKTAAELQEKINDYFENGVPLRLKVVTNKISVKIPIPTITGLILYCGFASRQSFYDLEANDEFSYTIKKARLAIEQHYEELLQGHNPTGAIFALKNFGWIDKHEVVSDIRYTEMKRILIEHKKQELDIGEDVPKPVKDRM